MFVTMLLTALGSEPMRPDQARSLDSPDVAEFVDRSWNDAVGWIRPSEDPEPIPWHVPDVPQMPVDVFSADPSVVPAVRVHGQRRHKNHEHVWMDDAEDALLLLEVDWERDEGRVFRLDPTAPSLRNAQPMSSALPGIVDGRRINGHLIGVRYRDAYLELVRIESDRTMRLGVTATSSISFGKSDGRPAVYTNGLEGERVFEVLPDGTVAQVVDVRHRAVRHETIEVEDGTRIPVTRVWDGATEPAHDSPMLVEVYGGFGLSNHPTEGQLFDNWLRAGGVWVTVGARGGGERGPTWHQAARGVTKERTVMDVNGVVEALHASGVGVPGRTALWGESNGGLIAAAAVARRPDLYGAVAAGVGPHDLVSARRLAGRSLGYAFTDGSLFAEIARNPRAWWNSGEYPGAVPGREEREAAIALSPAYTRPAGPLPPVLLYTGERDAVVHPLHSVRLALAWADVDGGPVLLQVHPGVETHESPPPGGCSFGWYWSRPRNRIYEDVERFLFKAIGPDAFPQGEAS